MRTNICVMALAVAAFQASTAWSHGPQIQLTADNGKITTREILIDDYVPETSAKSIYVLPVASVSGQWLVQPPGTTSSGPGIAPGVGFVDLDSHPFKSGNYTTSLVDGLKKWNGTSFIDAGDSQLQLYKTVGGDPLTATTTDNGPFESITFNVNVTSESAHTGMGFRFLGDGVSNTSALPDGVYLLSLKASHGTLTDSDPFYFVLPKGVAAGETGAATFAFAQQQGIGAGAIQAMTAIPEPTGVVLAALAFGGVAAMRRRGQRSAGA